MRRLSLFLDLDGTLIELAEHPEAVTVPAQLPQILGQLDARLHGALAMASGRNIDVLDRLLSPYRGSAIGVHGTERRLNTGAVLQTLSTPLPAALRNAIAEIVARYPGAFIEDKGSAIAVHERDGGDVLRAIALTDALQAQCVRFAPGWQCLSGRRVVEIKPAGIDKGKGTDWLMQQPPFAGALPVALGDDITDLDMFAAVMDYGGLTLAVGERIAGDGHLHLRSPAAVLRFLSAWSASSAVQTLADVEALARQADSRP